MKLARTNCTFQAENRSSQKESDVSSYEVAGALTIRPPTNRPHDISTHTIRPPDKLSAMTFYYCDIPSQKGRIVRPPQIVTFRPSKFGRFVTV
jgi:hypothetical protein